MYIREYMTTNVITVSPDTLVADAEKIMQEHDVRRLPVIDRGKLVGLLTQKDLTKIKPSPATSLSIWELNYLLGKLKVKEAMVKEKDVVTISPSSSVEEAIFLGQERRVGVLPVMDNGKLVGIVTITDLFKIISQALGLGKKGIRLHIFDCEGAWRLKNTLEIVLSHKANIQSLFQFVIPASNRNDTIIRLDTIDATELVNDLRTRGYTVETRWK